MMANGFTVEGVDGLRARLEKIGRLENAQRELQKSISNIGRNSQARAPYKTGRLKHSMTMQVIKNSGGVAYSAPYAYFVEEGTRYMAGRHYLKPVYQQERAVFLTNIKGSLLR